MERATLFQKGAFALRGILVTLDAGNYAQKSVSPLAVEPLGPDAFEDDEVWLLREIQKFLRGILPNKKGPFTEREEDAMRQSIRDFSSSIVGADQRFNPEVVPDEIMAVLGQMRADASAGREVDLKRYSELCTSAAFWAFVRSRMREHFPEIDDNSPTTEQVRQALGISREEWGRDISQ